LETIDVDGLSIGFERAGEGPSVVLVHGYVGDGPTTWRPQLEALSDEFTVVAWDAPGTGRSTDPPEDFGITGYADCLAGFVVALGLGSPHVVGLSFGGALVLELARRHPEIPRSLVLVSAYAGWRGSLRADVAEQRLEQAIQLADLPGEEFVAALLPTMFSAAASPGDVSSFGQAMRAFHPAGFRAMARASAEDVRAALPEVRVPTLLVYGDSDERAPLSVAEHLRGAIVGSKLAVLPGVGHVCNVEAPTQFNAVVRGFLREQGPRRERDERDGPKEIVRR
jgi:pimeloyl-ACP methyl ester carboxylesterase